jgi:hypothetical protein
LFVRTAQPLAPHTLVEIAFALPKRPLMRIEAVVCWVAHPRLREGWFLPRGEADERMGMGIRFTRVSDHDRQILREFFGLQPSTQKRVVIINDDPILSGILAKAYRAASYAVEESSWLEALSALGAPHVLALVEITRPGLARVVLAARNQMKTPLVAIFGTAQLAYEWQRDRQRAPTTFQFVRPVDIRQVVGITATLLGEH